jgi:hypothetical protein
MMDTTEAVERIVSAIDGVMNLREALPDDMQHTASRNRLTMALLSLEDARDSVAAAKARVPNPDRSN